MRFDEGRVVLVACAMSGGGARVTTDDIKEMFERMRIEIPNASLYTRIKTLENEGKLRIVGQSKTDGRPFVVYGLTDQGREEVDRVKYAMAIALQAFV